MSHLETSPYRPEGRPCVCLINHDHTTAEFYDYHGDHLLHPIGQAQVAEESRRRRVAARQGRNWR
jgi:hypothetical protein